MPTYVHMYVYVYTSFSSHHVKPGSQWFTKVCVDCVVCCYKDSVLVMD